MVVTVVSIVLSLAFERGPTGHIEMFCHTEFCIFGWTNPEWVFPMLMFGLFIGVICMAGYNYSVQYISPLVFSSLTLLEPAVTGE
jgi:drug/metabolite transporter (DMT)-like permease